MYPLIHGLANVFSKEPDNKYLHFCKPFGICRIFSTVPLWHESSHRQYINFIYQKQPADGIWPVGQSSTSAIVSHKPASLTGSLDEPSPSFALFTWPPWRLDWERLMLGCQCSSPFHGEFHKANAHWRAQMRDAVVGTTAHKDVHILNPETCRICQTAGPKGLWKCK